MYEMGQVEKGLLQTKMLKLWLMAYALRAPTEKIVINNF